MLRKLFVLCSSLAAAAVGFFLWRKRDELGAEIERIRGERRAGLRSAPSARHGAPKKNGAAASVVEGLASFADARAARRAPKPQAGPGRVPPEDTGAATGPGDSPAEAEEAGTDPGSEEARVTPLADDASPAGEEARCQARTRSGGRCSRPPEPGSDYCWQHEPGN